MSHGIFREYREHAETCQRQAEFAQTPSLRAAWLMLAADWLALIPPDHQDDDEPMDSSRDSGADNDRHHPR